MDKRALTLEIDLLLKKINTRHQKMMSYGADIPEGFAELLQQEVLALYRKYVQLEFVLQSGMPGDMVLEEMQLPQDPAPALPEQTQPPVPAPEPEKEQEAPAGEKETPPVPKPDEDHIVKLVQQALSGQGEPRVNPFATPQPQTGQQVQKPAPVPESKGPDATQPLNPVPPPVTPVPQTPVQTQQPVVKPVSTPASKPDEEMPQTLADKLRMQGIADLRKAIPIADKFLYMNELFQGEITHYNQALDRFNACANALEARDLFESMKQHFEWDENSKTVKRFADLLTRKFL